MLSQLARRSVRAAAVRAHTHAAATTALRACVASTSSSALAFGAQTRSFASAKDDDNSHSDFAPKYHAAKSTEKDEILKMIDSHVKTYPVMLYMKGTPSAPQCGFSMQVVRILHGQGVSFDSVNVLDHPEIRDGVKEYSQWPTIPQLYVKGEFVGGCDIVTDMNKSGELSELLAEFKK
ncbi:Grx4 family monothiol glutaredoxin, partial [Globisporangium splendens]